MRGIAFVGGEGPGPEVLKKLSLGADLLVAADSGLIALEDAGLKPHWIVGDMDSLGALSSGAPDGLGRLDKYAPEQVLRYPADKDFTDTELAINLLHEKGCDEIWIVGGGGGRTDHLFAIRSLFEREKPPRRWFTANEDISCLDAGLCRRGSLPAGSLLSVFPLGGGPWEAESSGLKWPLKGLGWDRGKFGLSNVALDGDFEIVSLKGRFMIIMPVFPEGFESE